MRRKRRRLRYVSRNMRDFRSRRSARRQAGTTSKCAIAVRDAATCSPSNIVLLMQLDENFNVTADEFFYSNIREMMQSRLR